MSATDQTDIDDAAWAKAEGVPSLDEPFLQKYLDGRDALVAEEKRKRSDHAFRESLSPMAAEASAIVAGLRFEEQQTIWNAAFEDNLAAKGASEIYPGMMFLLAKDRMESSKLWNIVRKMPKGALLHCHMDAMGDWEHLLNEAFNTPGMCISASQALANLDALDTADIQFQFVKDLPTSDAPSIWSESYVANQWVPLTSAASSFPDEGKRGFVKWLTSRVTIVPEVSLNHHHGPNDIWRRFQRTFSILASIQRYQPIFRKFIHRMLSQLNEDGVRWVDLRTVVTARPYWKEGASQREDTCEAFLEDLENAIEDFKQSDEGKGFWGARLIWTSIRAFNTRYIIEDMKKCIEMKLLFPDLISGYDLVGQEDLGRPLADITPELFWFKKKCAEEGVDIPFIFHAGETLGDGDQVDENLFDAVLLGTRRIGHGFSLYKHPLLIDMIKEKKILVESCPISNEVLRLTSSILSHPLPALLARGVPCALSNDDPLVLGHGTSGMTHDFWQALQGWENLGFEGLASLAENSIRWALYEDCSAKEWAADIKAGAYGTGIRAERLRQWRQEFEKFCQWVVLEYGADQDIDTLD